MKYLIVFGILMLASCKPETTKVVLQDIKPAQTSLFYKATEHLILTGDFNGDGQRDTLFENTINSQTGLPIDSFPDPWKHDWDTVVGYAYQHYFDLILSLSIKNTDTLHLGVATGFLFLMNIGDNNHDKKDEIALVRDGCDFSRVNHCYIYTLCNAKWVELNSFYIHEGAFDSYDDKVPDKNKIEGFFEKKKGRWYYLDYIEDMSFDKEEDVGKLKPLKLKSCK